MRTPISPFIILWTLLGARLGIGLSILFWDWIRTSYGWIKRHGCECGIRMCIFMVKLYTLLSCLSLSFCKIYSHITPPTKMETFLKSIIWEFRAIVVVFLFLFFFHYLVMDDEGKHALVAWWKKEKKKNCSLIVLLWSCYYATPGWFRKYNINLTTKHDFWVGCLRCAWFHYCFDVMESISIHV